MKKIAIISLAIATLLSTANGAITMDQYVPHHKHKSDRNSNDPIYVHIIPHTHDDVGWLKTPDEYFSGWNMETQKANVELILETVIRELLANPERKFSYVEMKFFSMWWSEQSETMKANVRQLVKEGRLEFLNAGWSMHDEACPYFEDMINNMMHGHQFVLKEFGVKPKVAWHIDPFGHSSANPRLFAEMGFDAWFFARLDYQDREQRLENQEMEWLWRPFYDHQGSRTQILTHALYHHYSAPDNFNFDTNAEDDPIVDDKSLSTYNVDVKIPLLKEWLDEQASHYKANETGHLFVVFGDDFQYQNARQNFQSMDLMIKHFNANYTDMVLMYSTPSEYVAAVGSKNVNWPTKYDDMFPYADNENSFWTGYFTSRANAKGYIRKASANMHASTKLYGLQAINQNTQDQRISDILTVKNKMMDVMGVVQHHDAVTGTAKQHVAENYNWRISRGMAQNNNLFSQVIGEAVNKLIPNLSAKSTEWKWCSAENSTYLECPIAEVANISSLNMIVSVFNPSTQPQNYVSIAVPTPNLTIQAYDFTNKKLVTPNAVAVCENETLINGYTVNNCWLYIELTIDAWQYGVFTVSYSSTNNLQKNYNNTGTPVIESQYEKLTMATMFDATSGQKFTLEKKEYNQTFNFAFDLRYWPSFQNDDEQRSGAYIFRVENGTSESTRYSNISDVWYLNTTVVSIIRMNFTNDKNESAIVYARLYKKNKLIEWTVRLNGIPLSEQGQEVVLNFNVEGIDNNKTFYTDSNGLEMQKRILDHRDTWNFTSFVNITQNYYPINSAIAVKDVANGNQVTLMTPRSLGGSSLKPGMIEVMHNRRMYKDDSRGVDEPLNETDAYGNGITVTTTYYLQIFNRSAEAPLQRIKQQHIDDPLQYFFNFNYKMTSNDVSKFLVSEDSHVSRLFNKQELQALGLPETAKIQIFPMTKNQILIRLVNLDDKFDWNTTVVTPQVQINDLANQLYLLSNGVAPLQTIIQETSHTGNQLYVLMQADKTAWKGVDDGTINPPDLPKDQGYNIALEAQRIRTFQFTYVGASSTPAKEEMF